MSENFKHTSGPSSQNQPDVAAQLQKIQQHLIFLEKKMDTLIAGQAQSQAQKSSFPRKDFSRPRRSFGQTEGGFNRRPQGRRDFQGGDRSDRGGFGQPRFGQGKSERSERPAPRFDKSEGSERPPRREGGFQGPKKKFFGGKKPFPRRDRD